MKDRGTKAPDIAPDKGYGVDEWSGDREKLVGLFPGEKFGPNWHEHLARCGGYFAHTHPEGQEKHSHTHRKCEWCR